VTVPGLDAGRCAERNLAAALKGFNSAPVLLAVDPPPPPDGWRLVTASASLPQGPDALARINAGLNPDAALAETDVYLLYPEVANDAFIQKYWMFLGVSTLKNVAAAAEAGISFMNSHRTGGMSTPAELPYGTSFAGRFETLADAAGRKRYRTLTGVYMLRGQAPNGTAGPTTDALFANIQGGVLNDVSLGFKSGGTAVCDVCGVDALETDEEGEFVCGHVPGTRRAMTAEMTKAQLDRGVPGGCATFTLDDAWPGEVSAVFDGAVPGAGFRKAVRLARKGSLAGPDLAAAAGAYAFLLSGRALADPFNTRPPAPPRPPVREAPMPRITFAALMDAYRGLGAPAEFDADALAATLGVSVGSPPQPPPRRDEPPAPPPAQPPATGNGPLEMRLLALEENNRLLQEALQATRADAERARLSDRAERVRLEAHTWADAQIRLGRLTSAERVDVVQRYLDADADDQRDPRPTTFINAKGEAAQGTRLQAQKALVERRPANLFGTEVVASDPGRKGAALSTLANGDVPEGDTLSEIMKNGARKYAETRKTQ
jgi:hypothetical protein